MARSLTDRLGEIPGHQLAILEQLGVAVEVASEDVSLPAADLIIDALIGYNLRGAPRGRSAALIRAAKAHGAPILSLDVPSGVDTTEGVVHDPSIKATATMTVALPKQGLAASQAKDQVGELCLADISVPPGLYAKPPLNLEVGHIFAESDVIRLW